MYGYACKATLIVRRLFVSYGRWSLLASPLVWVTTELGRTYLFTGFPWNAIGYAAMPVPLLMQSVSVTGMIGMNALGFAMCTTPAAK